MSVCLFFLSVLEYMDAAQVMDSLSHSKSKLTVTLNRKQKLRAMSWNSERERGRESAGDNGDKKRERGMRKEGMMGNRVEGRKR